VLIDVESQDCIIGSFDSCLDDKSLVSSSTSMFNADARCISLDTLRCGGRLSTQMLHNYKISYNDFMILHYKRLLFIRKFNIESAAAPSKSSVIRRRVDLELLPISKSISLSLYLKGIFLVLLTLDGVSTPFSVVSVSI